MREEVDESTEEIPEPAVESEPGTWALREVEARFNSLFHFHPNGVFSLDLTGRFTSANEAALAQSGGYSEAELLDLNFIDLLDPADVEAVSEHFFAMLDKSTRHLQVRLHRKDGLVGELEIIGLPIVVDDEVTGIYGIAEDVTERRRVERLLDDARAAAQDANEAKSRFLATVSHEIRTPLTSVLAALEILADTELDERQQRMLAVMGRSGERLLALVNDILDFSRIEAGRLELLDVTFRLRDVLDEIELLNRPRVEATGLTLDISLDPGLDIDLVGDPLSLSHALGNLVSNAVKFTNRGHVSVDVSAAVGRTESEDRDVIGIRIAVADSGIGMTRDQQRTIFESFSQADSSITRTYGGSGLGLSISRELVELMGGTITVDSEPDRGSTFTVLLPLRHSPPL